MSLTTRRLRPIARMTALAVALTAFVAEIDPDRSAAQEPEPAPERLAAIPGRLPVVSLRTQRRIRDEPKVAGRLVVPGSYDGLVGVELRGQSSQTFAKRSYGLELRTAAGEDRRVGLAGMPPDGDWVLHGPWIDKTLMRNALAYDSARMMGAYAPRTRMVELRLDGRRQGVYLLAERPELSSSRIDVEGDGVSGKYLLEWTFSYQARRKGRFFRLPITGRPLVYEDPEAGDLEPREGRYLRGYLRRTERALYGRGSTPWRRLLDEPATIDYVLVQELFRNVDAFHASTYLVKPSGGKLRFGPVWDFDLSSGNARQRGSASTRGWWTRERAWVGRLWDDCTFRARLGRRWHALAADGLRADVLRRVDAYAGALRESGAARRNFARWPTLDVRLWQNPRARGSYDAEVRYLRSWLDRRMRWMSSAAGRLRC